MDATLTSDTESTLDDVRGEMGEGHSLHRNRRAVAVGLGGLIPGFGHMYNRSYWTGAVVLSGFTLATIGTFRGTSVSGPVTMLLFVLWGGLGAWRSFAKRPFPPPLQLLVAAHIALALHAGGALALPHLAPSVYESRLNGFYEGLSMDDFVVATRSVCDHAWVPEKLRANSCGIAATSLLDETIDDWELHQEGYLAAELGCRHDDRQSCQMLADAYDFGIGCDADPKRAVALRKKLCRLGEVEACDRWTFPEPPIPMLGGPGDGLDAFVSADAFLVDGTLDDVVGDRALEDFLSQNTLSRDFLTADGAQESEGSKFEVVRASRDIDMTP